MFWWSRGGVGEGHSSDPSSPSCRFSNCPNLTSPTFSFNNVGNLHADIVNPQSAWVRFKRGAVATCPTVVMDSIRWRSRQELRPRATSRNISFPQDLNEAERAHLWPASTTVALSPSERANLVGNRRRAIQIFDPYQEAVIL